LPFSFSCGDFIFCTCRWHDAGTYDAKTKTRGANGSIRHEEEYTHGSNAGLKIAIDLLGVYFAISLTL
jgi:catalase (peroxidase I)